MIIHQKTILSISNRLNLPVLGIEQDWPLEISNYERISDFIEFFNKNDLSLPEKYAVVALIISSYEDLLNVRDDNENKIWNEIVKILNENKNDYLEILNEWASWNELDIDNCFKITPLIRDFFKNSNELKKIELTNYSKLKCIFSTNEENTILYAEISGIIKTGSEGNLDSLYLFSNLVAHYFVFEPISLILDLRNLEYTWGNTILKALNFFYEIGRDNEEKNKTIIIVVPQKNEKPILEILKSVNQGNRIICNNYEAAIEIASKKVREYLDS